MINYNTEEKSILYILHNMELNKFFTNVFDIYEIRGVVGDKNGVVFEVRTKEKGHNVPHIHARYGEYNISIAIDTGEVLKGNLPGKKQKIAQKWVLDNKDMLITKWNNIVVKDNWPFSNTKLKDKAYN
ncbi:MAG: DUF4160 domain-containing protein [Clostridia bacterium]|nr:DUF4160 domain-containing protein [Clostridia bacterium]